MNQNIKTFEEFKKIYTSNEFQELLKDSYKIKRKYRKFITITLIWGIPAIFFMILLPLLGIITMLIGIAIELMMFGRGMIWNYPPYFRTKIPQLIAEMSGIQLKTVYVSEEEFFSEDDNKNMSGWEKLKIAFKSEINGTSKSRQYENKQNKNILFAANRNVKQFKNSKIIDADEYYASNIAQFIHNETDTVIDFYYAAAYKVNKRTYMEDGREYTDTKKKLLSSGVVFTFENLYNIKLNDFRILIKDDDTLISHLTENTIDSLIENKNELKFNRIDLNKSFDFYVYSDDKNIDATIEALQIVNPVVEDLISYIRKKYGRFNMSITNNKIDIEFLDTSIIGGNKRNYKDIIIKPKVFSNNDLKISYLYKFYELIEIQKLILKYLNCYPEKYLITEDDVNGLKEAVESKKLSDYEMDKSVQDTYKKIKGVV